MDNGNPFVTPQSTPFCLYGKYTFNSSANGSSQQVAQNIALNADYPVMVLSKPPIQHSPLRLCLTGTAVMCMLLVLIPTTKVSL